MVFNLLPQDISKNGSFDFASHLHINRHSFSILYSAMSLNKNALYQYNKSGKGIVDGNPFDVKNEFTNHQLATSVALYIVSE